MIEMIMMMIMIIMMITTMMMMMMMMIRVITQPPTLNEDHPQHDCHHDVDDHDYGGVIGNYDGDGQNDVKPAHRVVDCSTTMIESACLFSVYITAPVPLPLQDWQLKCPIMCSCA